MSIKIKAIDTEKGELVVEIDASKTKNLGATRAVIDKVAADNGLLPHTITKNFPIFKKHKGLSDELQLDIHDLIVEKTDLERKAAQDKLRRIKTNSQNARWLTHEEVARLIEIIKIKQNINPNNFWRPAKKECVEYLNTIDEKKGKRLKDMDPEDFAQYIYRNAPGDILKKND